MNAQNGRKKIISLESVNCMLKEKRLFGMVIQNQLKQILKSSLRLNIQQLITIQISLSFVREMLKDFGLIK